MKRRIATAIISTTLLSGCGDFASKADLRTVRDTAELAEQTSSKVQSELDELRKTVDNLDARVPSKVAVFNPSAGPTYVSVPGGHTEILLVVESVEEFGTGSRLHLLLGNASTARLENVALVMQYGFAEKNGDDYGLRSHTSSVQEPLMPGRWNKSALNLPGVPPDRLTFVTARAELNNVILSH